MPFDPWQKQLALNKRRFLRVDVYNTPIPPKVKGYSKVYFRSGSLYQWGGPVLTVACAFYLYITLPNMNLI